jgi:hypothetical protein
MSVRVSCPYCNAGFALIEVPPTGRADCPRCGERFPVRAGDPSAAGPPAPPAGPGAQYSVLSTTPPAHAAGRANSVKPAGRTALVAAAAVLVLAAGLGVYLSRGGSGPAPEGDPPPDAAAVPPLSLRGLGYLPPGTNVAFAVRPGPVLEYAARTGKDPVDILTKAGVPASTLGSLAKAGVTLQQIDHVAGGVAVPDAGGGELRFAVAVVLRRPPADEDEFLKALKARRTGPGRDAGYAAEFAGLPLAMARASATDWVFALSDRDAGAAGGRELAPGLREAVAEKVPADAAAWVATDSARWADKPAVRLAVGRFGRPEWLPALGQGRAAVAGLSLGEEPQVRLSVRCADAPTGDRLAAYFRSKATGEGARAGGDGEWASFDAPFDPSAGFGPFRRMLDEAGR